MEHILILLNQFVPTSCFGLSNCVNHSGAVPREGGHMKGVCDTTFDAAPVGEEHPAKGVNHAKASTWEKSADQTRLACSSKVAVQALASASHNARQPS